MLFFTDLYKIAESKGIPLTRDFFKYYFENIKSLKILKELTSNNYISWSVWKTNLYTDLKTCLLKVLPNQQ